MARLDLASGRLRESEAGFRRFAALGESKLTGLLLGQGRLQEALRVVKDAAAGDASPALKALLGELALQSRDFPLGIDTFRQLSESAPQNRSFKLSLAQAHLGKRDLAAALGGRQSIPSNTDPLTLLVTAQAYSLSAQYAAARPLYEKLTALRPNNPAILNNPALSIVESGGDPDAAPSLDTLGYVYLRKTMTDDALRAFRTVVQKGPGYATYRYHQALALLQKGDNASAKREMKTALASNPDPDTAAKIGTLLAH